MGILKYLVILGVIVEFSAAANFPYNTKYIKEINDIVLTQKSNTVVVLVVKGNIIFVSTEGNAPQKLAECRKIIKGVNLEILKTTFEELNTNDVVEKLGMIGATRHTYLVYFRAHVKPIINSITIVEHRPVGLLGKLLAALGVTVSERGLVPIVLSLLGVGTSVRNVISIEFSK